jgi:hypothetical protein
MKISMGAGESVVLTWDPYTDGSGDGYNLHIKDADHARALSQSWAKNNENQFRVDQQRERIKELEHDLANAQQARGHNCGRDVDIAFKLFMEAIGEVVDRIPQWRPIETAPKDEYILVSGTDEKWKRNPSAFVAKWCGHTGSWGSTVVDVTHWMPLPEAPK